VNRSRSDVKLPVYICRWNKWMYWLLRGKTCHWRMDQSRLS